MIEYVPYANDEGKGLGPGTRGTAQLPPEPDAVKEDGHGVPFAFPVPPQVSHHVSLWASLPLPPQSGHTFAAGGAGS